MKSYEECKCVRAEKPAGDCIHPSSSVVCWHFAPVEKRSYPCVNCGNTGKQLPRPKMMKLMRERAEKFTAELAAKRNGSR